MEFFDILNKSNAINDVWKYVLIMLRQEYKLSNDLLNLLCIFFSRIDDGNICMPLDLEILKNKWHNKMSGLENPDTSVDYDAVIDRGIAAVENYSGPVIFKYDLPSNERKNNLFVIHNGWIFTEKFFQSKQDIEKSVNRLFAKKYDVNASDIDAIKTRYDYGKFELAQAQAQAIAAAKGGQNLIVTGGPGTGKTTVICYLLLELLSKTPDYTIYMAAPSGKAAQRMQESIGNSLHGLRDCEKQRQSAACQKISDVKPLTIHKLLGWAGTGSHETKKFPPKSIFVIDEASMIDVVLFSRLLNAMDDARIFILGDRDQLVSVQPGAVFCDLTQQCPDSLIRLTESHRFQQGSEIYKLKENILRGEISDDDMQWSDIPNDFKQELINDQATVQNDDKKFPVKYFTISKPETKNNEIQSYVTDWYDMFYDNAQYSAVYAGLNLKSADIENKLDEIWNHIGMAKILCAENHAITGTENINKIICDHIKAKYQINSDGKFFVGEQIIITKNQELYDLSNGDIGIIVSLDNKKYIMIKRAKQNNAVDDTDDTELIRRTGNYIFYPLYLLPSDAVEPAYAITIHKSQGSEYYNIMVFLPESEKSPLLNRQILYTAITRTKKTTYIVSSPDNMKKAIATPYERDTRLFL